MLLQSPAAASNYTPLLLTHPPAHPRALQTDVFFLTSPNVGKMHKIKVRSSGSGLGAAWHLARIVITSSATGEKLPFPFNNWIDKEHGLEHVRR